MIPKKTIDELIVKHSTLEKELSSGEIDKKMFAEKSKDLDDPGMYAFHKLSSIFQNN